MFACAILLLAAAPEITLAQAVERVVPRRLFADRITEKAKTVVVVGRATSHEDVADYMRALSAVVSTPRGFGRIVEQRREAPVVRVELFDTGHFEDFGISDLGRFNVELRKADGKVEKATASIAFELQVRPK